MKSRYQHQEGQPFHISIGAVVVNGDGEILVHKRERARAPEQFGDNFIDRDEVYILMRESLEEEETIVECVLRGVREEFGCTGTVGKYLGAVQATVPSRTGPMEKTTPYFLVTDVQEVGPREEDNESFSVLEWHPAEFLRERMVGQGGAIRPDLDESRIIEAYIRYGRG
ncbi:MAG: NUDIX domain-containing protein [Bacillota bacterium]